MKLLVALDLSAASRRVIDFVRQLAESCGYRVYLLHVAEPEPEFMGYDAGPEVVREQVARELHREHQAIQQYAEELRADGVDATALLIRGSTVEVILAQAQELGANLLVMGTHGHSALFDLVAGSVCLGVIRHATIPVLLVPVKE